MASLTNIMLQQINLIPSVQHVQLVKTYNGFSEKKTKYNVRSAPGQNEISQPRPEHFFHDLSPKSFTLHEL